MPAGREEYPEAGSVAPLRLIRPDGSEDLLVAEEARTYFENRAAVWKSAEELIYIAGEGRKVLHHVDSRKTTPLVREPEVGHGWLIDSTLSHATMGRAVFASFDRHRGAVVKKSAERGCQPYFSHDGRWGFWMAGAGGPINRIDLGSGEISTVLSKNDPRLPEGLGYLYFPMISRDGLLFTFSASPNEHDHFRGNYEVFVAECDPGNLEIVGEPVRMTHNAASDRFPDVFLAPLALGRHRGEAPFEVELKPGGAGGDWEWSFGDGGSATAPLGRHVYQAAGSYEVEALRGAEVLRGRVAVAPARPPLPIRVALREEGKRLVVWFDEEIQLQEPRMNLVSGHEILDWSLGEEGRSLMIRLAAKLESADRLRLTGIADRAQIPNSMETKELAVEPPLWPSRTEGLVFLWETGEAPNLVFDSSLGADRASTLRSTGRGRLDHDFAMVVDGGSYVASAEDAQALRRACQASNELSLEVVVEPSAPRERLTKIVAFATRGRFENFSLAQRRDRLLFRLVVAPRGPDAHQIVELMRLPPKRKSHVVVTYSPGRLNAYLDGELIRQDDSIRNDFFHWRQVALAFGDLDGGGADWAGRLEGIALYDRALDPDEVRENFLRYRSQRLARPPVQQTVIEARLRQRSRAPTLAEITPYREALSVFEYEVERTLRGQLAEPVVRVAHWTILGGEILPIDDRGENESRRLTIERFSDNRQLEGIYLADTLEELPGAELHFAVRP
jgi:hypothetical protein